MHFFKDFRKLLFIEKDETLGDNQMSIVHLNYGLSGLRVTELHRRVRLGMHGKVEKK